MKLEVEGALITVGTSWDTVTDLKISYTNPQGEAAAFCIDCTKEQAAAFGKHLYRKVRVTIEVVEENTVI